MVTIGPSVGYETWRPFFQAQIKENIKAPRHWPLCGEFTGDRWSPVQRASYAENVSIWWRHHEKNGGWYINDLIEICPVVSSQVCTKVSCLKKVIPILLLLSLTSSMTWIIKVKFNLQPEYLWRIWPVDDLWPSRITHPLYAKYLVYHRNRIKFLRFTPSPQKNKTKKQTIVSVSFITKILQIFSTYHDDVIKWKHFPLWCFLWSAPE